MIFVELTLILELTELRIPQKHLFTKDLCNFSYNVTQYVQKIKRKFFRIIVLRNIDSLKICATCLIKGTDYVAKVQRKFLCQYAFRLRDDLCGVNYDHMLELLNLESLKKYWITKALYNSSYKVTWSMFKKPKGFFYASVLSGWGMIYVELAVTMCLNYWT